eukprot:12897.XXX_79771_81189_1 [CDS] Oithona nana genome sequencing.
MLDNSVDRTKFLVKLWALTLAIWNPVSEVLLWCGTCTGTMMMLTLILLCDFYLVWKPALFSILPDTQYKEAFLAARNEVMRFFRHHMHIMHRHEIKGFEKIPETGGALIVYYHGPIPLDYMALLVRTYLEKGRLIRSVMDRNLIMMPGAETFFRTFGFMPGGREEVIKLLKEGHLVGCAPGGGYEAQLATADYPIMWKQRKGFAVVAKEAQVPIIPMFTENIKEAYVNMQSGMDELWSKIYEKTRVPITPIYGGFPVKLTTYLSDPIPSWDYEVEDLRLKAIAQIQDLINEHQQLPGNVVRAIKERLEVDYSNDDAEIEEPEDDTIIEEVVEDEFQSAESICSDGIDDVIDDSGCGSFDEEDYEDMDDKMNSQDPIVQLPNGKLVLFSGFSVVRRLSLA